MATSGGTQVFILILCLSELLTVGILIFSHGFLLTRQVVLFNSSCEDFKMEEDHVKTKIKKSTNNGKGLSAECWMTPTFRRAVLILIDALRYDFAAYNHSLQVEEALHYQNKMPVFKSILQSRPRQAYLVPFIADAPTTTMQRLKGLTTGSLPTFIDASHNFASEEISEDNIVDQLVSCGKRITVLGDDTWGGLFPGRFNQSFLYPSFNVMDLHTVDNGVLNHLEEEMLQDDWDVIIAHFLGVDHCGHRYGPNHPEMAAKLKQMNNMIKKVADNIENDTVLFIFGDHGMTKTGDHGGDSSDEVKAALFLYSPVLDIMPSVFDGEHSLPIAQVDIVPSLALALGVPIPYSSLGRVMENIVVTVEHSREEADHRQLVALAQNVKQVRRYLKDYKNLGNVFPPDNWQRLEELNGIMLPNIENLSPREQKKVYIEYLTLAKLMCEEIWAKFNVSEISSGLFLMFNSMLLITLFTHCSFILKNKIPFVKRVLFLTVLVNALFVFTPYSNISVLGYVASFFIIIWMCIHRQVFTIENIYLNKSDCISLLLAVLMCLGSFSNSFVVMENYVVAYILLSSLLIQILIPLLKRPRKKVFSVLFGKNTKLPIDSFLLYALLILIVFMSVRLSSRFWKCREEQSWCSPSQVHTPMTGLQQSVRNWRYFTSLFSLILLVWLPRRWLLMCGNLNGSRLGVILFNSVPVMCGVLVAAYWALQASPTLHNVHINEYVVIPPRVNYALTLVYVTAFYFVPLLIYELPQSNTRTSMQLLLDNPNVLIPKLCQTLMEKYSEGNQRTSSVPVVYGLATAVSAPLVSLLTVILVVIVMVAGDGFTPAVILLLVTAVASLLLQAISSWKTADSLSMIMKPSWSAVCIWFILSIHGFYSTGHHPTFPSLHWSAAFVGFEGEWNGSNLIPALLVGFNTFSSQILFGLALPLVLLAPLAVGVIFPKLRCNSRLETEEVRHGEFLLMDEPDKAEDALVFLGLSYILLHATKVFCSAVSAFILRRHLMVWKIFAPHFIFEAVGFIITGCSVLAGIWFTLRIIKVLKSWSEYLHHKNS